jgi:hypothetical protein
VATGQGKPTTAGYSGTPLHRKLGINPGSRVLLTAVPDGFDAALLDPDGAATVQRRAGGIPYDVVLAFCPDLSALHRRLPVAMDRTAIAGRCWIAWPKRASGIPTDLNEDLVRQAALDAGWVDVKVCAIDATWSGLCLVRRLVNR